MPRREYLRDDRRLRVRIDAGQLEIVDEPGPSVSLQQRALWLPEDLNRLVGQTQVISRLVFDIPVELAAAPWETLLGQLSPGRVVVRTGASRAPQYGTPLLLPMRILHVHDDPSPSVTQWINRIVESPPGGVPGQQVVAAADARPSQLTAALLAELGWPNVDVLHLTDVGPEQVTTGDLERFIRLAQCRLLVLEPLPLINRDELLTVAERLHDRGAPAVLVPRANESNLEGFYSSIVHDMPLDVALRVLDDACLYGGAEREDALRYSSAGRDLIATSATERAAAGVSLDRILADFESAWDGLTFEISERAGLIPMSDWMTSLRAALPTPPVVEPDADRVVNASLHTATSPIEIRPRQLLPLGQTLYLRIEIGPLDPTVAAVGLEPLLVERRLWDETEDGLWLEVGVTGIGWEVQASPVQPVLLPRTGPSQPCWFPVRPTEAGAPALRYTVYHNGHIIQSFRFAAVVAGADPMDDDALDTRLGAALGLPPAEVAGATWRTRLEFSTVATLAQARERPTRELSIVANEDALGRPVLTFKTVDEFEVRFPGDVDTWVGKARELLDSLTFLHGAYAYGIPGGDPNATARKAFIMRLPRLAQLGAALYEKFVPLPTRNRLAAVGEGSYTVQVAHILREKVIPWALIYQGKYDPPRNDQPTVCTAVLDVADPAVFTQPCGTYEQCAVFGLPDAERETAMRALACPRRIWGFRHRLEVPPGQVEAGRPAMTVEERVDGGGAAAMLAVSLDLPVAHSEPETSGHRWSMRSLLATRATVYEPAGREELIAVLNRTDLEVIYVLCTAEGGDQEQLEPCLLYFDSAEQRPIRLSTSVLDDIEWSRHPIVILNGCGTAAFSSRAVSQFIQAFVDDRQAAALLGTEAPISDRLGAEVGELFLSALINGGSTAGDALLAARRSLLRRHNPLGLSYTLYGTSELRVGR